MRPRSSTTSSVCTDSTTSMVPLGREPEVAEVALVALHPHLGVGGGEAQVADAVRVGIDGDRLGAESGEGDGVAVVADAELDDPAPRRDVADEPELVVAGDVVSVCHVVGHGVAHSHSVVGARVAR